MNLKQNKVGDDGMILLSKANWMKNLKELDLQWNGITELGARKFAGSLGFPKLRILKLWGNEIGERGRNDIEISPNFKISNPIY